MERVDLKLLLLAGQQHEEGRGGQGAPEQGFASCPGELVEGRGGQGAPEEG